MKIAMKERRYKIDPSEWAYPPCSDIQVTYKVKSRDMQQKMYSSNDLYAHFKNRWPDINLHESFMVAYMTRSNTIIGTRLIGMGGLTGTIADPKMILQTALLLNACSMALAHNHPSGSTKPSRADEELTKQIREAAKFHDILILDHIILTENDGFYSFADEGLI